MWGQNSEIKYNEWMDERMNGWTDKQRKEYHHVCVHMFMYFTHVGMILVNVWSGGAQSVVMPTSKY